MHEAHLSSIIQQYGCHALLIGVDVDDNNGDDEDDEDKDDNDNEE